MELVTDYVEDALSPADRRRFEEHLGICPGCVTYLEQTRLTVQAAGSLTEESLDPALRNQLLDLFRNWNRASS